MIVAGASYPIVQKAFPSALPILCGQATPAVFAVTQHVLFGKIAFALALLLALPLAARVLAGSWLALTRVPAHRAGLIVAGIATTMLTAYDMCTGFHAAQPMAGGCACWLTALVAGFVASSAALAILAGRSIAGRLHRALFAIVEAAFRPRRRLEPLFLALATHALSAAGILLARRHAGRGPPAFA